MPISGSNRKLYVESSHQRPSTEVTKMPADMVLISATVVTMNKLRTRAQAIAIKNGKISEVGDNDDVKRLVGQDTKVIDLIGKTIVPGLIDAHAHMMALVNPFPWLDLRGVSSIKEIQEQLHAKIQEVGKGKWILGRGWDQDRLKERRYPTRWDLDKASRDNPVLLSRICGHVGVANSNALKIARIDEKTALRMDELVERDLQTGEPTGILLEKARDIVWNLPKPSEEDLLHACSLAFAEAAKVGLTSVHWFAYEPDEIKALETLRKKGEIPVRVYVVGHVDYFDKLLDRKFKHPFLMFRCIKILADGSLGARTAALKKPYSDDPSTRGILNYGMAELKTLIRKVDKAGYQASVHVIGDLAMAETLKAFKKTLSRDDIRNHRHRIEHASVLNPALIKCISELGLLVCVQPHFVVSDFWIENRLGSKRARWTYPFKSLMRRDILLAGSSDAPAEELNPILGIWAAVARKSFPQERLSVEEALKLYTINAACMSFEENVKGSLEIGKFADLTVLSDNPLEVEPDKIKDIKVEMTIVGGKIVYSAES